MNRNRKDRKPIIINLDDEIESSGSNSHVEILEKLGSECSEALRAMAESYGASLGVLLTETFKGWNETVEKAQDALTSAIDAMKPSMDALQSIVGQNDKLFTEVGSVIAEFGKRYEVEEKRASILLKKYKWFVTPSIGLDLIWEVSKIDSDKSGTGKLKRVNDLFINHFRANNWENLDLMVLRWKKSNLIAPRHRILLSAITVIAGE